MSNCPECDARIAIARGTRVGEIIVCPDCHTDLEIMSLDPIELALAPEVEEDWGE